MPSTAAVARRLKMRSGRAYSGATGALLTPHPGSPETAKIVMLMIAIAATTPGFIRVINAPCLRVSNAPFLRRPKSSTPQLLEPAPHRFRGRSADELARTHGALRIERGDRIGA